MDIATIGQYTRYALDVLLIATIIYQGYRLLESTRAIQLIKGVIWVAIVFGVAVLLRLETLLRVVDLFLPSLVIAIAVIFQPELRQIVNRLGRRRILYFGTTKRDRAVPVAAVVTAAKQLQELKRGGLIVFPRGIGLQNIIESGVELSAFVTSELLVTIFMHNNPLHDGAVVISRNKLVAAGCILPLSIRDDAIVKFGTRHRAGLGIAEESDAVSLIISEEQGTFAIAHDGVLYQNLPIQEVQQKLNMFFSHEKTRRNSVHDLAKEPT